MRGHTDWADDRMRTAYEWAGFDVVRAGEPYLVPFGSGHPEVKPGIRQKFRQLTTRSSVDGVPYAAALCRPAGSVST